MAGTSVMLHLSLIGCLCWWTGVSHGAHHSVTLPPPPVRHSPPHTPHPNTHPHPQDAGVLVGRRMHGAHHRAPFEANYAIVSGWWNPILDKAGFFRKLEKFIHE